MKKRILLTLVLFAGLFYSSQAQVQCIAMFNYNSAGTTQINFYDSSYVSSGSVTSWQWSFGDGNFSTQTNPSHTYSANGTYQVCLIISTSTGCIDTSCATITVNNCNLTATIYFDTIPGPSLAVLASGGITPYTFLWSTSETTSSIQVTTVGTYCVTVTDVNACSVVACYQYTGGGNCFPYFSTNVVGNSVQFINASSGNYSSWLWIFGDGDSSSAWSPTHIYPNGVWTPCLYLYDSIGNILCQYCTTVTVPAGGTVNDTICGQVFIDLNGNGVMDSSETGYGGGYVLIYGSGIQYTASVDSLGHYVAYVPDGTYTIVYCIGQVVTFTVPPDDSSGCAFYNNVVISGGGTFCGYNFGFQYTSAIIEGTVFIDMNNNGIYDSGEPGAAYQPVQVGSYTTYTNGNGFYSIWVPTGTYIITYTPSGLYSGFTLTTAGSITVNATTVGSTYGNNDFGIYLPPGSTNLSVNIIPHTTIAPGFPAWYDIQVCNIGSSITGGTLTMFYDPGLNFVSASPTQATHNAITHQLTWNVPILTPGQCDYVWVDFDASTSLQIGDNTFELVTVVPNMGTDIDMSNNTDSVHQVVTSSWDPNNKLAVATNYIDPNYQIVSSVNPDQSIEYTINFQNLGTAPAVNISVLDDLVAQLDANSFVLLGTSHNAQVTRLGNQLTFLFSNIMLPDATTNAAASHGFINFRVNSQNGLPVGTVISDDAAIYFDFNSPVITNLAMVEIINPTGIEENNSSILSASVYPNPVQDVGYINFDLKKSSFVNIELLDMAGKKIEQVISENVSSGHYSIKWNVGNVTSGLYLIRIEAEGQTSIFKLMVK